MQGTPVFYREIVPLDRARHATLHLAPRADYRYALGTNSVFLAAVEFAQSSREYPIVFADDGESTFPLAILGLRDVENLFVTPEGGWAAAYVPAYVRRYPFILSTQPDSDILTVCIDRSYPNLNNETRGLALFEGGEESAFLKESIEFLRDFQNQYAMTIRLAARLKELGLLEPMQANVELKAGPRLNLGGFFIVNRERLLTLPAEQIVALVQDGSMELIYLHLNSLDNFARLIERLAEKPGHNLADTPTVGNA